MEKKLKVMFLVLAVAVMATTALANLVPNAGFEAGIGTVPDGWVIESGATKITWSDEAYTGSKSMLLTGTMAKPEAVIYSADLIPVTAGTEYTFSAMVKLYGDNPVVTGGTNLRLRWINAAGAGIGGGWNNFSWYGIDTPADWTEVTALTIEAPEGAVEVQHGWLYSWKGDKNNGVYIDDVSMTAVPEPATMCLLGFGGLALLRRRRNG